MERKRLFNELLSINVSLKILQEEAEKEKLTILSNILLSIVDAVTELRVLTEGREEIGFTKERRQEK